MDRKDYQNRRVDGIISPNRLPPVFKAYSPRTDFQAGIPATHGCAIQFDFRKNNTSNIASMMLKVARQNGAITDDGDASFDWEHERLYTKLTIWEIGHVLSVLNERRAVAKFLNKSHEGDIAVTVESEIDGDDMGVTKISFMPTTGLPMTAIIQPYQAEPLRVFLEEGVRRILFSRAS